MPVAGDRPASMISQENGSKAKGCGQLEAGLGRLVFFDLFKHSDKRREFLETIFLKTECEGRFVVYELINTPRAVTRKRKRGSCCADSFAFVS